MTDLIQQLKDNRYPFGLMSEEMRAKAKDMDIADFQFYTSDRVWEDYPAGDFYYDQATRLNPDYEEKQGIVECEVYTESNSVHNLLMFKYDGDKGSYLNEAPDFPDFIGFKFEDGIVTAKPRRYKMDGVGSHGFGVESIDSVEVLTPIAVLYRKMEHSKLPWYVTKDYYGEVRLSTTPQDATNIDGRNAVLENTGRGSGGLETEDADFIVKACNEHDNLTAKADLFEKLVTSSRTSFRKGCPVVHLMTIIDSYAEKAKDL